MIGGVFVVIVFLLGDGGQGNFFGFFGVFILLFFFVGIGNGFIFCMILVIFCNEWVWWVCDGQVDEVGVVCNVSMELVVVIGFFVVIGVFGGFFILKVFGILLYMIGSVEGVFYVFIVYYLSCIVVIWWWYVCKGVESFC